MKSILTIAMIMSSFSTFAINVGDEVMETKGVNTLQIVRDISQNGKFFLSDGNAYKEKHIHILVDSKDGIKVGMSVLENRFNDTIKMVKAITDSGIYMLEDDETYTRRQISHIKATEQGQLKLGMEVLENSGDASLQTIIAIAENQKIILSDEKVYDVDNVHILQDELHGIRVGEEIREHSEKSGILYLKVPKNSIQTVTAIANDHFFLDNGNLRDSSQVFPLQDEYYGIQTGACVKEIKGLDSTRLVEAISGALFLLSDGNWYNEYDLDRNPSQEKCQKIRDKINEDLEKEEPAI